MNLNELGGVSFHVIPVSFTPPYDHQMFHCDNFRYLNDSSFSEKHKHNRIATKFKPTNILNSIISVQYLKMTRIHWEKEDRIELEKSFALNPHPDSAKKQMIADKLRVEIEKIDNFFKNKRQKLRRSGIAIKRVFHEESPA